MFDFFGHEQTVQKNHKSNLSFGEVQPSDAGVGAQYMQASPSALPLGEVQSAGLGAPYMLSQGAQDYASSLFSGIF